MSYFDASIDARRRRTIARALKFLRARTDQFDAIAFSGMSGATMAPILAYMLNKQLIIVRKDADLEGNSHATSTVEYADGGLRDRILIVDDFVSSGATIRRIMSKIHDVRLRVSFVAVYCYERGYDDDGWAAAREGVSPLPPSWEAD